MHPARLLLEAEPDTRIVVLVDALDELSLEQGQTTILNWLAACPQLPPNLRFVLSSRPDQGLNILKQRQHGLVRELIIDPHTELARSNVRRYVAGFCARPDIHRALAEYTIAPEEFAIGAVDRADGNFQYVAVLTRAIDRALELGTPDVKPEDGNQGKGVSVNL
jgi:hypothetical protein